MTFSVKDIQKNYERRNRKRIDTIYSKVLIKTQREIDRHAKIGKTSMFYRIPMMIPGLPLFDTSMCADYIKEKLKEGGFKVKKLVSDSGAEVVLYVSWQIKHTNLKLLEYKTFDPPSTPPISHSNPPSMSHSNRSGSNMSHSNPRSGSHMSHSLPSIPSQSDTFMGIPLAPKKKYKFKSRKSLF